MARDCTNAPPRVAKKQCYHCGSQAHWTMHCKGGTEVQTRRVAEINTLQVAAGAGLMIPVDDDMYVQTQIDGIPVDCLVDSGSRCSVVSTEIYAMLKRKKLIKSEPVYDELNANGVTGRKVECYGHISLPVELGTLKFDANFWIMYMVANLIIGLDVCRKQGIKLDIPNNRLEIQRRGICLLSVETTEGEAK